MTLWRFKNLLCALAAALAFSGMARADVIFDTGEIGGFLGFWGPDISQNQSVAVGFTPGQAYTLDDVSVWIMSNDFDNAGRTYTLSVRTDAGGGPLHTVPSDSILESWNVATQAVGWQPVLEQQNSVLHPTLAANTPYWIVAESNEPGGLSPVWVVAQSLAPFANIDFASGPDWQGGTAAAPGTLIRATPVPEPSAGITTLVALMVAAGRRRNRP